MGRFLDGVKGAIRKRQAAGSTSLDQYQSNYGDGSAYNAEIRNLERRVRSAMKQKSNLNIRPQTILNIEGFAATQRGRAFMIKNRNRAQLKLAKYQSQILATQQEFTTSMNQLDLEASRNTSNFNVGLAQHKVLMGMDAQSQKTVDVITKGVSDRAMRLIE